MKSYAPGMPTLYLGHGAPPLVDDPVWPGQLATWAASIDRPKAILIVSAHWENAPLSIAATSTMPLVYDFWGFPERYYQLTYPAPGAPQLAARVRELLTPHQPVSDSPKRGLDHGAFIPLLCMWPEADVPVLQISMPSLSASALLETGRQLAPLRDEGVLIIGSGFLTHGLPFIDLTRTDDDRLRGPLSSMPGRPNASPSGTSTRSWTIGSGHRPSSSHIRPSIIWCLCSWPSERRSMRREPSTRRSQASGSTCPNGPSNSTEPPLGACTAAN